MPATEPRRLTYRQPAPEGCRFAPEAFDGSVGNVIPMWVEGSDRTQYCRVVSATVNTNGEAAMITIEILENVEADPPGEPSRTTTPRGFIGYDQFVCTYGNEIRVYESSAADGPHCWVSIDPTGSNSRARTTEYVAAHLDVKGATRLRNALDDFLREIPERWADR